MPEDVVNLGDNFEGVPAKFRKETEPKPQNSRKAPQKKSTYSWQENELMISFNTTALADPTCTRLEPPITWLAASGARVRILTSTEEMQNEKSSIVEVAVSREFAEYSLRILSNKGFSRDDIFRMLDKGPWVLAFDIPKALPRLFEGLQNELGLTQTQSVHIVSHCPYLLSQYARYKGRDVFATAKALLEVGYTLPKLVNDVMRFPSMLAAPPDRIRGWMALLEGFGIATTPALFGKMLKRAPFMFYVNPPKIGDDDISHVVSSDVSTTASGFVAYEVMNVLQLLRAQNFPDLDKIVRTQPSILLVDTTEVMARANFLFNLFAESVPSVSRAKIDDDADQVSSGFFLYGLEKEVFTKEKKLSSTGENVANLLSKKESIFASVNNLNVYERSSNNDQLGSHEEITTSVSPNQHPAHDMLGALLLTYPAVLSINHKQMRAAGNALRTSGLAKSEVLLLTRRHPPVLGKNPDLLINLISFLRYNCGLSKSDLLPFFNGCPSVLGADIEDIEPKVDYLFQSLGGSQEMLRRFPSFLSYDLESHIRPRAEFLRAMKIDPLINGLSFLVNSPPKEIAYTAGVKLEFFNKFQNAYIDMWKKKDIQERSYQKNIRRNNDVSARPVLETVGWEESTKPEESFNDELELSF
eukprot:CAMPEP_0119041926 /NCGR_PEP_ID=MMETSP1177-20130426/14213_1 /TAXON_ID=2985 /ORGANISM="Ochromonas sp, Strain CCMP1899" /LENGTH=640 /DNA_ID=CAMNT_0007008357 /DNA_START=219 /DNA_END=2141 /DNA_ORIENTATION=-